MLLCMWRKREHPTIHNPESVTVTMDSDGLLQETMTAFSLVPLQNPEIFPCILVSFFKGELTGKNELLGCLKPEKYGKMVFTLSNPPGPLNSGRKTREPSRKAPALIPHLELLSSSSPRPFAGNAWQYMPGNKFWRFNKTIFCRAMS